MISNARKWIEHHPIISIIVLSVVTGLALVFFVIVGLPALMVGMSHHTESASMSEISDWAYLPKSAKLVSAMKIERTLEFEIYAEVEMSRKEVQKFIVELKKNGCITLSRTDRMYITNRTRNWFNDTPVPKWWNPDSAKKFIACWDTSKQYPPFLLISLDNPNKAALWVHIDTNGSLPKDCKRPSYQNNYGK